MLRIVETPVFTRRISTLLDDREYSKLQLLLALHPDAGAVVQRSGGIWKLRRGLPGRGKRGGLRIIYFRAVTEDVVYMLYVYDKADQEGLTPAQLKTLRSLLRGQ